MPNFISTKKKPKKKPDKKPVPDDTITPVENDVTEEPTPPMEPRLGRSLYLLENTNQHPGFDNAGYTCVLSSEDHGGNLTYEFDPDPSVISWGMMANLTQLPTRGGQLVYSTGRLIGPFNISGFLRSTWDMFDLADFVKEHMTEALIYGKPLKFTYPERDLEFSLYIQSFNEIGINSEEGELKAYTLTSYITQDHRAIKVIEMSQLGIPENVEWIDPLTAALVAQERFPQLTATDTGVSDSGGTGEEGEGEGEEGEGKNGENKDDYPEGQDVVGPGSKPPKDRVDGNGNAAQGPYAGYNDKGDDPPKKTTPSSVVSWR